MAMSMTTTSGRRFSAKLMAWRPVSASAITVMSGSDSRRARSPCRTTVWSSASRTRIFSIFCSLLLVKIVCFRGRGLEWNQHTHGGSAPRFRLDIELAVDQPHPLLDSQQAEVLVLLGG